MLPNRTMLNGDSQILFTNSADGLMGSQRRVQLRKKIYARPHAEVWRYAVMLSFIHPSHDLLGVTFDSIIVSKCVLLSCQVSHEFFFIFFCSASVPWDPSTNFAAPDDIFVVKFTVQSDDTQSETQAILNSRRAREEFAVRVGLEAHRQKKTRLIPTLAVTSFGGFEFAVRGHTNFAIAFFNR
jgi:hypothetical protein